VNIFGGSTSETTMWPNPAARGGILADEMGMGKTIQSVTLMLANLPPKTLPPAADGLLASRASLVVAPVAALMQWKHEIEKYTRPDSVSVVVYHGPNRAQRPEQLASADIVLTTFSIVESEFRRFIAPAKVALGLGRIAALYHHSSTSYQIC
jgi:DNA repair protein RAD16